jgi:3-deoxy-D-manno-octulosonic-acid transferase
MLLFYNLATRVYFASVKVASIFNEKASKMIVGRKDWRTALASLINKSDRYIWIHCASLGEFEQGRALIEKIKKENTENYKILLTFFSPSGFEVRKDYPLADIVFYLPFDTPTNAYDFVKIVNPEFAVFVKYEIWFHMLAELSNKGIPVFLISGIFRKEQIFFRWYGKSYRRALSFFTWLFLQDNTSAELLKNVGFTNADVCGDTRIDRVINVAQEHYNNALLESFTKDKKTVVCGSTWPADERIISRFINKCDDHYKFIIAPHEIDYKHLVALEKMITVKSVRLSVMTAHDLDAKLVIVDSIGILSKVYRFGQIAYIGGGFGKGIHNILEAAVYELPILIGPNYEKFREACELVDQRAVFVINSFQSFENILRDLNASTENYNAIQKCLKVYINNSFGASQHIIRKIRLIVKN